MACLEECYGLVGIASVSRDSTELWLIKANAEHVEKLVGQHDLLGMVNLC